MGGRVQPALLGGVFIGVLSTLPIISVGNMCCCLWVVSGGALSVWLLQQNSTEPLTGADGALMGLLSGIVGAFIGAALQIPVEMWFGPIQREWLERLMQGQEMPPQFMEMLNRRMTAATVVFDLISRLVIYVIFGMLGGILGVAIFRRRDQRLKTQE